MDAHHLPENDDAGVVDEVIACETSQARAVAGSLARDEGLVAGTSSGAVLFAASVLAGRPENAGRTIVAIVANSGERYLSQARAGGDRPSRRGPAPGDVAALARAQGARSDEAPERAAASAVVRTLTRRFEPRPSVANTVGPAQGADPYRQRRACCVFKARRSVTEEKP